MNNHFNGLRVAVLNERLIPLVKSESGQPAAISPDSASDFESALPELLDGAIDLILFSSDREAHAFFQRVAEYPDPARIRDVLRQMAIGATDPATREALRSHSIIPDFEPDRMTEEALVRGMARLNSVLIRRKRAAVDAGVDTTHGRRIDMRWPRNTEAHDRVGQSAFMKACRGEPTDHTPVWLMRQAGRYQRLYNEIRSGMDFLDMCKTPEITAEITLMAFERLGVDAAILFADLLPVLQSMGLSLEYVKGEGPVIHNPVRSAAAIDQLEEMDPASQGFVYETIRLTLRAIDPGAPLIGFAGGPFTLAAYAIEGGSSRHFRHVKTLMYTDPGAWRALMEKLARGVTDYLNAQIDAGVHVVQLFDSWVGCLSPDDYREFVLPYTGYVFAHLRPGVPTIHFGVHTGALLELMTEAGGDVLGLDWHVDLAKTWERLDYKVAVQGNLDPIVLYSSPSEIRKRVRAILHKAGGRPGHIFNLGHGILPDTPEDHVTALVDAVHEMSGGQPTHHPAHGHPVEP